MIPIVCDYVLMEGTITNPSWICFINYGSSTPVRFQHGRDELGVSVPQVRVPLVLIHILKSLNFTSSLKDYKCSITFAGISFSDVYFNTR